MLTLTSVQEDSIDVIPTPYAIKSMVVMNSNATLAIEMLAMLLHLASIAKK